MLSTCYVSLDIVKALVDEVNEYDISVKEAMEYLNIDFERIILSANITWKLRDKQKTYHDITVGNWFPGTKEIAFNIESDDEDDDYGKNDDNYFSLNLHVNMEGKTIPLFGPLDVTSSTYIEKLCGMDPEILKVELVDAESTKYNRFRPAGQANFM